MDCKNKLIVLDGLDGCGKSTQFERIYEILKARGIAVKAISFPDYDKPSSTLVKMYLNGEISKKASDVNAYAASTFYAADRYASFQLYWKDSYQAGDLILASRYVSSNAIHQMAKLNKESWDEFLNWLEDFEYNKLELPKPDKVIFLDMPIEVSQKLMTGRYDGNESKKDIHERDLEYLYSCRESALYAAQKKNWCVIPCSDGKNPYSIDKITEDILKEINEVI